MCLEREQSSFVNFNSMLDVLNRMNELGIGNERLDVLLQNF